MRSDRPEPIEHLDRVTCPACGHFAAWRLDHDGRVTSDKATAHRCAIWACRATFVGVTP